MNRTNTFKSFTICCLLLFSIISGCKKDKVIKEEPEEIISPTTGTRTQFTLDSIFLYARQVYLWKDALPTYAAFNPRVKYDAYPSEINALKAEVYDISQMKLNPVTNLPYEYSGQLSRAKYSSIEIGKEPGRNVAAIEVKAGNPVTAATTFTVDATKVGYIAISTFPKLAGAKSFLDAAFSELAATKPKHVIVDLRNNGGGFVETAEYVANLIAPSALNGKVAYIEQFNEQMQQGKATILKHQPYLDENNKPVIYKGRKATMADVDFTEAGNTYKFSKKGNLETIETVYFIVTENTASASELLISSLKPHLSIKLAGSKTYGKPVGFFGVAIDKYTVYLSGFLIKNAAGYSDYFDGMNVDILVAPTGTNEPGNPNDSYISKVLSYIQTGKVNIEINVAANALKANPVALSKENDQTNRIMIEHRMKLQ